MTPERRLELFLELCELTAAVQRERPNRDALRRAQSPSPEALALWARLMQRR